MRPRRLGAGLLLALVALAGALAAEAGREPQVLQEPQPTANAAAAGSAPAPPPSISRHHHHQRRRQQHWEPGDARAAAEVASRARDASPHDASDDAGAGEDAQRRRLLQTPTPADCNRSVPNCVSCRYQFFQGTVTKAVCLNCDIGYTVRASGRGCWCAPGYFRNDTGACVPCGPGAYCPGARGTETSGALRIACGVNKATTTTYARSDRECVVLPGFGWAFGDGSSTCPVGFYNPGYNTRKCTKCAGSLTTLGEGSKAPQECVAPPGFSYQRGRAVPCGRGFYKPLTGNVDCTPCPDGWTTKFNTSGMMAPTDCQYLVPGYYAPAGMLSTLGTAGAVLCPQDTYRSEDGLYGSDQNSGGLNCTACPAGLRTQSDGSTTVSQCLAPPGYGFDAASGTAALCPRGTYNPGWNREPCVACGGGNFTTDAAGSTTSDECKVPAGYGAAYAADGRTIVAAPCEVGTYGRDSDTYGLVEVECTKCMQYTTTAGVGSTSGAQCLTLGGYGWYNGAIQQCDYAYYSPGNNQDPCTYCGEGYNTSTGAAGTSPVRGATSAASCVVDAGWTSDGFGGVKPCMQGFYKSLLGPSTCVRCPNGTTTTLTFAPAMLSDCDACRPGFGASSVDLSAPSCAICPSGTYSFGYVTGGADCLPCPTPDGYNGSMVSRRGLDNPDECYPEFMTNAAFNSLLRYNYIPMADAVMTVTWNTTAAGCEAACGAAAGCQYFVFTDYSAAGSKCSLRNLGVAPADISGGGSYILLQISAGDYVAYAADPTDWDSAGTTLASFASLSDAMSACDKQAACVGIKSNAGAWRTFAGALLKDTTAKVRVSGAAINPWIPEPPAN